MTRDELIAALEKADAGNRELDTCIAEAVGIRLGQLGHAPPFTTSLDAALTLVPEGWAISRIDQYHDDKNPAWGWGVDLRNHLHPDVGRMIGESRTSMALALCIAALRARGEP